MNERELYKKADMTKRNRVQRKKRRKRKKKQFRFVIILLLLAAALLIFVMGRIAGDRLIRPVMSGELKLPWGIGTAEIVLDAGHGGKDQGASGGDAVEKEITLDIAEKTEKILKDAGYKVKMTRDDDIFAELEARAEYANRKQADVFVSIHCNSSESGEGYGVETFYSEQKEDGSLELAQYIQENIVAQTGARDREVKTADYVVIVNTEMPAVLVETGFLSNPDERLLLQQEDYQEKLAQGIAEGIIGYLERQE